MFSSLIHGTSNVSFTILRLQRWWTGKPRLVIKFKLRVCGRRGWSNELTSSVVTAGNLWTMQKRDKLSIVKQLFVISHSSVDLLGSSSTGFAMFPWRDGWAGQAAVALYIWRSILGQLGCSSSPLRGLSLFRRLDQLLYMTVPRQQSKKVKSRSCRVY